MKTKWAIIFEYWKLMILQLDFYKSPPFFISDKGGDYRKTARGRGKLGTLEQIFHLRGQVKVMKLSCRLKIVLLQNSKWTMVLVDEHRQGLQFPDSCAPPPGKKKKARMKARSYCLHREGLERLRVHEISCLVSWIFLVTRFHKISQNKSLAHLQCLVICFINYIIYFDLSFTHILCLFLQNLPLHLAIHAQFSWRNKYQGFHKSVDFILSLGICIITSLICSPPAMYLLYAWPH